MGDPDGSSSLYSFPLARLLVVAVFPGSRANLHSRAERESVHTSTSIHRLLDPDATEIRNSPPIVRLSPNGSRV